MKRLFALLLLPSIAFGWETGDLNKTVDQTNFIVDSRCSGTLISLKYRLILTANHCVEHKVTYYRVEEVIDGKLEEVKKRRFLDVPVVQKSYSGSRAVGSSEYLTEIVARAEAKDLALLRIRAEKLPYTVESKFLPAGITLQRGETIWTAGNPNLLDASVSTGVISSMTRMFRVPWANNEEIPFLQHDAATTGGSSGGAVYSDDGYLIGVHVAGYRGVPLGFAVHPDTIRAFLDEMCYPVYEGGVLSDKCEDFGKFKPEEEKDEKGGGYCDKCKADFVQNWWQQRLAE